jgi:heat shock protein HslJ
MYKYLKLFGPLLAALTLAACDRQNDEHAAVAEQAANAPAAEVVTAPQVSHAPPSWQEAANLSYRGVFDEAIALRDGAWQGEPYAEGGASAPRAGLVADFLLKGDLDGDGADEAVVLLWSSSGGSGTFDYLAVVDRGADGVAINRATAALGDRVKIRSAAIEERWIVVHTVQAGAQDAACCPGQNMRRSFALEDAEMSEISSEDLGRMSLADLAGEWRLVTFGAGEEVPPGVEITVQVSEGTIAGKAACNRYTGGVQEGDMPGDLSLLGPLALTRMMCPPALMEWERRYVQALEGLAQYSFQAGKLVLSWRGEGGSGSMSFARVGGAEATEE